MRTLFGVSFDVVPNGSESTEQCFKYLMETTVAWVNKKYGKQASYDQAWKLVAPISAEQLGRVEGMPEGHHFVTSLNESETSALRSFEWQHPHHDDEYAAWRTNVVVGRYNNKIGFSLALRIISRETVIRPLRYDIGCPKLVYDILSTRKCDLAGWPVSCEPATMNLVEVSDFVDNTLLNPTRVLPIVVLSPDVWGGKYAVRGKELATSLAGLAHVVKLEDKWAAFQLTNRVGKEFSCYNGAVRIYWPGLELSDDFLRHKLYFPGAIAYHESQGRPFSKHLFRVLSTISAHRYTEGSTIPLARTDIRNEAVRKQQELRRRVHEGTKEKAELEKDLYEALEQLESLQSALDELTEENEKLRQENADLRQNWKTFSEYAGDESHEDQDIAKEDKAFSIENVEDAMILASDQFPETLIFHETAEKQAQESPFKNPSVVYGLFVALDELIQEWRRSGYIGTTWKQALRDKGFGYKPDISMTSSGKYGDDYTFTHDGKEIVAGEHVTFGKGQNPQECLSVHWWRDEDQKRIVICRCGKHGRNTKT